MELLRHTGRPSEPADETHFTGLATLQRFLAEDPSAAGRVYRVAFATGARTHWHTHDGVQLLLIVEGRCEVQTWGGPVITADAGDVVRIEAGEKHWHGASADHSTAHFAVNLGTRTEWLEGVEERL